MSFALEFIDLVKIDSVIYKTSNIVLNERNIEVKAVKTYAIKT